MRIMIVEDVAELRRMWRCILEKEGYSVIEASNGEEAMAAYREEAVDLVITDLIMPEKSGLDLIRDLRKEFPEVKIIATSGGCFIGPVGYLDAAEKFGALYTLMKPFDPNKLLEAVKELEELMDPVQGTSARG